MKKENTILEIGNKMRAQKEVWNGICLRSTKHASPFEQESL